jgi:hypothetical protein
MLSTILIVLLILVFLGALPTWPYSQNWGYYPSSMASVALLIILILAILGRI